MKNELSKGRLENDSIQGVEDSFKAFSEDLRYISEHKVTLSKIKYDITNQQIPILKNLTSGLGTCALSIFDIEEKRFLYVEDAIEDVTGISKKAYLEKGIKYLFSRLAYDNIPSLIKSTFHERMFLSKLNAENYSNYIINREYAFRHKGYKKWILQQTIKHLVNAQGRIFAIVTLETNIDHLKCDGKFRYYIYGRKENRIIYPKKTNYLDVTFDILSKREKEVVDLLAIGYTNKAIAEKLCISFHTVRTHRKNIFKKLGCNNLLDMVRLMDQLN